MNYLALIRKFPLRPIKSLDAHETAVEVLIALTRKAEQLSVDELDYVSVLAGLVAQYEAAALKTKSTSDPRQALRYLLEVNGLRPVDLVGLVEKSHVSAFLSGTGAPGDRKLSKTEAARLGAFFKVDPMLFLDKVVPITSAAGVRKTKPDPRTTPPKTKSVFGGSSVAGACLTASGSTARKSSTRKATAAKQSAKKKGASSKRTKGARRPARG
jgi:HTH-type transcriptional regulator/antitoxin HigA